MNPRKIREDLGRIRTCIQRRDYMRAVQLFIRSLKDLGGQQAPIDLRGDFRTALADLCGDALYKKNFEQPLAWQPGKEKEILAVFEKLNTRLTGQAEDEDYDTALQRKINLDRCINDGKAFLSQGKPSDADDCFAEAIKYYRDEIMAFGMMARAMMDAGEYVRALGYVRMGLKEQPKNPDLLKLGDECQKLRAKAGK